MAQEKSTTQSGLPLTEMQHYVTQQRGTEPAFSGKLLHNEQSGDYHCLICHAPLFLSESKYNSGCGWPSFFQPVSRDAIRYLTDRSHGMERTEIRCAQCDSHLGHVFPDGPQPEGERYCVNSVSLSFTGPDGESKAG